EIRRSASHGLDGGHGAAAFLDVEFDAFGGEIAALLAEEKRRMLAVWIPVEQQHHLLGGLSGLDGTHAKRRCEQRSSTGHRCVPGQAAKGCAKDCNCHGKSPKFVFNCLVKPYGGQAGPSRRGEARRASSLLRKQKSALLTKHKRRTGVRR